MPVPTLGGTLPLGLLAALFSSVTAPQNGADPNAAATQLAAKMRQQTPDVPPPAQQPSLNNSDDTSFNSRWNGMLNSPSVPLPQPRPASAPQPGAPLPITNDLDNQILSSLPQNATPTQGPAPPQAAPAAAPSTSSPGLMDRVAASLANFGAGGRSGGLLGALSGAIAGASNGQRFDPIGVQNQTVQALTNRGISPDMAQIMARDPQMLNQVLPLLMGVKPWQVTETTDIFGQKRPILINPLTGESKAVNVGGGEPRGGGSVVPGIPGVTSPQGGASPAAAPSGTPTIDNFNMSAVNPDIKGWDYLKQLPLEVQSAAQAYMTGGVMPSGNPRNQGISTVAKMAAQKVAMDLGQPQLADDTLFSERRKMRTDLGSSSQSSMGGILSNGKSAFEHLGTLSDAMVNLGNYNGPNIPGGALLGEAGNVVGNTVGATAGTKDKLQQVGDAALKYGQESTKFYSGTGGGEGERTFALNNVTGPAITSAQQAGFLQTEKSLMMARLQQKEAQIRDTLGQQYLDQHPVVTPDLQATLNKIDTNIAKLRGQSVPEGGSSSGGIPGATTTAPAQPQNIPPIVRQNGHIYQRQADGTYRAIQ